MNKPRDQWCPEARKAAQGECCLRVAIVRKSSVTTVACLCCHNKIPYTGPFIKNRALFFTVLEAGDSPDAGASICSSECHMAEGGRTSLLTALRSFF
jgi:hypothetical protein